MSREAFLLISSIRSCGGNWGLNVPIDVLRGSRVSFVSIICIFEIARVHVWAVESLFYFLWGMSEVSLLDNINFRFLTIQLP